MNQEILKTVGQIAGLGGIALGVLLILFREVIRKNIFPNVTKSHAYKLLRLIIVLAWSVAIVGIVAWVYVATKPQTVTPSISLPAESKSNANSASPSPSIAPLASVKSPSAQTKSTVSTSPIPPSVFIPLLKKHYSVTLVIPAEMSEADVLVDDAPAVITKRDDNFISVKVIAKTTPTRIRLIGKIQCSLVDQLIERDQRIPLTCAPK